MKKVFFALFTLISVSGHAQVGWTQMFNGTDLTGWTKVNGDADYTVENGTIVGTAKLGSPNSFLAFDQMYGDFVMEFDFKVANNFNSGVQFRSHQKADDTARVFGYQFEIDPSQRGWTGGIYDEARNGWQYTMLTNPAASKAFKSEQWNTARIEAIGTSIRTWVNGVPVSNLLIDLNARGMIALQVHSIANESQNGLTVEWRNIRITEEVKKFATPDKNEIPQVNKIPNTISKAEAKQGWKLLWDGKTTTGWKSAKGTAFPEKGWKIEDGILQVEKSTGGESTNGGDIITIKEYENFELKVDFKITEGANSGIKYFVQPTLNMGEGSSIGCEFQILDDQKHPDAKLGKAGNRTLGSLYDLITAPANKPFWKPFFNTARIVVQGNHVEHWLNDVKIVEYERNTPQWNELVAGSKYAGWKNFGNFATGNILLQDHGDQVFFHSIKIKVLK